MHHGLLGWDSVPGLKLQQCSQELHGLPVQPRDVETQGLSTVHGIAPAHKLAVLVDPRPRLLRRGAQDLYAG